MPKVEGFTPGELIEMTARLLAAKKPQPTPEEIIAEMERWMREDLWTGDADRRVQRLIAHMRHWLNTK
jgi:hypothetical protein